MSLSGEGCGRDCGKRDPVRGVKRYKISAAAENATSCVLCSVWQPVP